MRTVNVDIATTGPSSDLTGDVSIRRFTQTDLAAVVRVEREAYRYPWSEGIFRDCLRVGYSCWHISLSGQIIGYGIMSVAAGESHILNICVDPSKQNYGFGRTLLSHLIMVSKQERVINILLEVRPTNLNAVHLYESLGFKQIGRRPGYYRAGQCREDALVFSKEL